LAPWRPINRNVDEFPHVAQTRRELRNQTSRRFYRAEAAVASLWRALAVILNKAIELAAT
jgi:hypothetical protein